MKTIDRERFTCPLPRPESNMKIIITEIGVREVIVDRHPHDIERIPNPDQTII